MTVTRIKRHLGVSVVEGEGVFLVCEHGSAVVEQPLAQRLLPLLAGKLDVDQVVDELDGEVSAAMVYHAIGELVRSGHALEVEPEIDVRAAGFWDASALHGDTALLATAAGVRLTVLGEIDVAEAEAALRTAGLAVTVADAATMVTGDIGRPAGPAALDLVITDDYLREGLAAFDAAMRTAGRPWLLAKPVGVRALIGPVFTPDTACYRCLENRIRGHRTAEEYLESKLLGHRVVAPVVDIAASRAFAFGAVATTAAHWLAGHRIPGTHAVRALDALAMTLTEHPVQRRPQCATCGDPGLVGQRMNRPVELQFRPKAFSADGGHRARTPEQMMARWGDLVDDVAGVVPELKPLSTGLPFLRAYSSGYNRALRVTSLRGLQEGLRAHSCGKGVTDIQARASALGEALERYSGVFFGDEPRRRDSFAGLGDAAIHPHDSLLYSDAQYDNRDEWNARGITFQSVPVRMDDTVDIDWSPVYSLTQQRTKYLPTSQLFFSYPGGPGYAWADSNGNAAGTSLEDAVLQGFYELVERDSVALWWYNRLSRPAVDLASLGDPWIAEMQREYAALGRDLWALDLTADLGVPTIAALSHRVDKPAEDIILAFGAHHDARIATLRAISELNQFLPAVAFTTAQNPRYDFPDPAQNHWWRTGTLLDNPHLLPDPAAAPVAVQDISRPTSSDLAEDVATCRRLVEDRGMEMLVLDMTRPDIDLPVVKVIVPGLRHFWARFAPGRLYDVPVQLGLLPTPTAEGDLNPIPMFV